MKVELNIDENIEELLVKIYTSKVDKEVQSLINYLESRDEYLLGFKDEKITILEKNQIIRIFTEDRKTYAATSVGDFILKKRLYEVENLLLKDFVKISQSEIANIRFIKNLDFSNRGTIVIKYKNGDVSYVSRRMIKEFKKKLRV